MNQAPPPTEAPAEPTSRLVVVLFFAFIAAALIWLGTRDKVPFHSQQWQTGQNRAVMVQDLIDSGRLLGKTPGQVERILGPPSGSEANSEDQLIYWTGTEGLGAESWLAVNFENGKVKTARAMPE